MSEWELEVVHAVRDFVADNPEGQTELLRAKKKDPIDFFFDIRWLETMDKGVDIRNWIFDNPEETIKAIEIGIKEIIENDDITGKLNVRITGLKATDVIKKAYGKMSYEKSIQELESKILNQLIVVEGMVKAKTDIMPELQSITWRCNGCEHDHIILRRGETVSKPTVCACGSRNFRIESQGLLNVLTMRLEESHEDVSGSEMKKIKVICRGGLANPKFDIKLMRGNRIRVIGIFKGDFQYLVKTKGVKATLKTYVEANNIEILRDEYKEIIVTEADREKVKKKLEGKDAVVFLAQQMYEGIYGYDKAKEALVCQMVGTNKVIRGNKKTRGSMHLLFLGDPGSGKSTLLKLTQDIALKCRYASGKGTSSVGITAGVRKDETVNDWVCEAGAFPLSHNGILCLDEFDKIDNEDKSALHEGMEQQTISINKANVHATLVAETSLLAAANPVKGRFDSNKEIYEQFNLMPTLVNRFDLIFVFKDLPQSKTDSKVADKIIEGHVGGEDKKMVFDVNLFKKYLVMVREINPTISEEAIKEIKTMYLKIRQKSLKETTDKGIQTMPISARQLESAIRIAKVHARANFKEKIGKEDVDYAINLITFTLGEISTDLIAGEIDIDVIETGISAGKRRLEDAIEQFVKSQEAKECSVDLLFETFEEQIGEKKLDRMIQKMRQHGDLIEVKRGFLRWNE